MAGNASAADMRCQSAPGVQAVRPSENVTGRLQNPVAVLVVTKIGNSYWERN